MEIINFIQQFSHPILDWIMRIITEFGDVYFYLGVGLFFYWIIDKKFAFKLMTVFLFSMTINGVIKSQTNKKRPYQEGARPILQETEGSSMPSGHSQGIVTFSLIFEKEYKRYRWLKYLLIPLVILVPFSRLYLGQHYLDDVLVGVVLGVLFGYLGFFLLELGDSDKEHLRALYFIPVLLILMPLINDNQIYLAGGAYIGLSVGYFLEKKYVNYDIKDSLLVNVLKLIIGGAIAFLLKDGLKILLKPIIKNTNILDAVRYMFVTLWASFGAMALFKVLFKKKIKSEEIVLKEEKI